MCSYFKDVPSYTAPEQQEQEPKVVKTTVRDDVVAELRRNVPHAVSTKFLSDVVGVPQATIRRTIRELGARVETRFRTREGNWVALA